MTNLRGTGMATVQTEVTVGAPAPQCWDALRDFGGLHERLAKGFVTDTKMVNEREREVTFASGAVARELLVGVDDASMRLCYTVVDGLMGASHHNASAQIVPVGADRCRFIWITDVVPDELAARTAALMDAGLAAIKTTLEAQAWAGRTAAPEPRDVSRFVEAYIAPWNDADPAARRGAVEHLWDERGTLVNGRAEYVGWAEVSTALQRTFDAWVVSGHRFRVARPPASHHDMVCLAWEMTAADGETVVSTGTNVITLSATGRILSDWQFVEP
jgi:hypothetical protein